MGDTDKLCNDTNVDYKPSVEEVVQFFISSMKLIQSEKFVCFNNYNLIYVIMFKSSIFIFDCNGLYLQYNYII